MVEFNKIAVVGSRNFENVNMVLSAVKDIVSLNNDIEVRLHGNGVVDKAVEEFCINNKIKLGYYPLKENEEDFENVQKANSLMIDGVDLVIIAWDGESVGTKDVLDQVNIKEIPNFLILPETNPLNNENNIALVICDLAVESDELAASLLTELSKFVRKDTKVRFLNNGYTERFLLKFFEDQKVDMEIEFFEWDNDLSKLDPDNLPEKLMESVGITFVVFGTDEEFYLKTVKRLDETETTACVMDYRPYMNKEVDNLIDTAEKALSFKKSVENMVLLTRQFTTYPDQETRESVYKEINELIEKDDVGLDGRRLSKEEKALVISIKLD